MSTTPNDTWAVDLADVTYIYPWVGSEVYMAGTGIILWLLWHVWQVRHENAEYADQIRKSGDVETIRQAIEND